MEQLERTRNGIAPLSLAPQDAPDNSHPPGRGPARRRRRTEAGCMTHDVWIYRVVVASFAAVLILTALGALVLAFTGKELPQTASTLFVALTSGAVGALAGLLAPSPKG
jgi:hypothetical protein